MFKMPVFIVGRQTIRRGGAQGTGERATLAGPKKATERGETSNSPLLKNKRRLKNRCSEMRGAYSRRLWGGFEKNCYKRYTFGLGKEGGGGAFGSRHQISLLLMIPMGGGGM